MSRKFFNFLRITYNLGGGSFFFLAALGLCFHSWALCCHLWAFSSCTAWALESVGSLVLAAGLVAPWWIRAWLHDQGSTMIGGCDEKVSPSCPTLCDPMNSAVHGILQARILEWVAIPFSRESSWPRDRIQVSHIVVRFFTVWVTRETQNKWKKKKKKTITMNGGHSICRFYSKPFAALTPSSQQLCEVDTINSNLYMIKSRLKKFNLPKRYTY